MKKYKFYLLILVLLVTFFTTKKLFTMKEDSKFKNRLQKEISPYLFQHKDNPVNWYAWGEEPFTQAKKENKPVFLSIGYSSCHWCHVMEEESFMDKETAKILNEKFNKMQKSTIFNNS